jgi:metal-responsive CopG/Arc/MetJ family transcriptional regulator
MATKTLNIALDEKLINEIDDTVRKDFSSRSEYFRRLALSDLERRRDWKSVLDTANVKGRKMGIRSEQQVYEILDDYKSDK